MAKSFKSDSRYVFRAMIKAWTSCDWSELHNNRQSEYHPWWKERPKDLFVLVFMSVLIHFSIQGVELWMGEMFFRRFSFFLCWYSCCCCSLSCFERGLFSLLFKPFRKRLFTIFSGAGCAFFGAKNFLLRPTFLVSKWHRETLKNG